jgi:hypothetical protein
MPADGDALLARITAGPGAGDAAGLGAAAAAYFGRVAVLRKTGKAGQAFSADDARKEGGVLVKLFSAAIKQQVCGPGPRALCPRLHDAVLRRCGGRPARLERVVRRSACAPSRAHLLWRRGELRGAHAARPWSGGGTGRTRCAARMPRIL